MLNITKDEINIMNDRLFIAQQADKFERYLASIDDNTRDIIRKNEHLNNFYDLFLDFILDSNQHLEKNDSQEYTSKTDA
jgi:hypothetical protein